MVHFSLFHVNLDSSFNANSKICKSIKNAFLYAFPFVFALFIACSSTLCNYFEELQSVIVSPKTVLFSGTGFEIFLCFMKCFGVVSFIGSICLLLLLQPLKVIKNKMVEKGFPKITFTFCLLFFYILIFLCFVFLAGVFITNTPSLEPVFFHH